MKNIFKPSYSKPARLIAATILTIGSLSWQANAELTLDIIESSDERFSFKITGDFSGLAHPGGDENAYWGLLIMPFDDSGNHISTWHDENLFVDYHDPTPWPIPQPSGRIDNLSDCSEWGLFNDQGSETNSQWKTPRDLYYLGFRTFGMTEDSIIQVPIESSLNGFNLDTTDVAGFDLYWGTTTFAHRAMIVPEPSSALLMGVGTLGFLTRRRRTA